MPSTTRIFLAPSPRAVADIFDADDLARLRALGELVIHEGSPVTDAVFAEKALGATIIMGQFDLPAERLQQLPNLKVIFNVEGNFLPNVDYAYCFQHSIRVLNVSPVFAEPVAETALGMAIDLARGISRSDRYFRNNTEKYGLDANREAYTLFRQKVGFIGMGASVGFFIGPIYAGWRAGALEAVLGAAAWRRPVLELGLLGIVAAGLFAWYADEEKTSPVKQVADAPPQKLFPTGALWVCFIASAFAFCSSAAALAFSPMDL